MNCDEVRELLELYALGALEPSERVDVDEHLHTGCQGCGTALKRALGFNAAMLAAVPVDAPDPALRARIVGMVQPAAPRKPVYSHKAWIALAAGLTIAVVWLGVDNLRKAEHIAEERQLRQSAEREAARMNASLNFLRDPETRPAAAKPELNQPRGTYFVNSRIGVMLIASNLPATGSGKTYQMWVIPKGQDARPAGLFTPDAAGSVVHLQTGPVDIGSVQALAITVEPEGGSPAPTTTPMLVTPVAGI